MSGSRFWGTLWIHFGESRAEDEPHWFLDGPPVDLAQNAVVEARFVGALLTLPTAEQRHLAGKRKRELRFGLSEPRGW